MTFALEFLRAAETIAIAPEEAPEAIEQLITRYPPAPAPAEFIPSEPIPRIGGGETEYVQRTGLEEVTVFTEEMEPKAVYRPGETEILIPEPVVTTPGLLSGLDITDVIAPFFPLWQMWKFGEQLPPEIAPILSPISAISTMKEIITEPEEVIARSPTLQAAPDIIPGIGDFFKGIAPWALAAGAVVIGYLLLRRK